MSDERDERIRQRAHAIWEREGKTDGRHEQHWYQAASEIDAEDLAASSKPATVPATPAKKALAPRAKAEATEKALPKARKKKGA